MQSTMIDLLLNSYLSEHFKSSDLSHMTISNMISSENVLSSLVKIYHNLQQSSSSSTNDPVEQEKIDEENSSIIDQDIHNESSQISITVCDEAKTLKRQFACNRSLLIREMRYFADYLKDEPEQLEEVDISVHCDLDIFQWLMSFVKRKSNNNQPILEPRIAVSILISSDFLKMNKLVVQSLEYIHDHLNEILATNCNVSCISELLFRQLAQYFHNPNEIEQLHDRKNRIRGKLFEYNLEQMLNEYRIIRCQFCLKLMTIEQMQHVLCIPEKFILTDNGQFYFQHKIDTKFDINTWVKEIHTRSENSWRNTFWIVWLHINGDQCARCSVYFRFIDFATCLCHPLLSITDGKHDCCSQPIKTFDIFHSNIHTKGCQQREHICQTQNHLSEIFENLDKVDLVKHHPTLRTPSSTPIHTNSMVIKIIEQSVYGATNEAKKSPLRTQWTSLLESSPCGADIKYAWDASKSTRWNQDAQREDEHRRFEEMLRYIHSEQQNTKATTTTIRSTKDSTNSASFIPGGFYCRIENEWRTRPNNPTTNNKTRQRILLK